jgi:hypothetical protein
LRGIQQRPEQIKNRPLTALGAQLSRRLDMFESRVIIWRKEKGKISLAQGTRGGFGS